MEAARAPISLFTKTKDLTRCGICKEVINNPKTLTCLHTFCLECLREWCKTTMTVITCPVLNCKKNTPIPLNGVDGLSDNLFVSSLIDKSPPCICCEETNFDVIARCVECNGFLCKRGDRLHQEKLLKSHQVIKLERKPEKVDMKMFADKKQPTCKEHKGSTLWFFCETCGVLICKDCTIVDHAKPDHNYVTLKSIAMKQRKKIIELVKQKESVTWAVDRALRNVDKAQANFDKNKEKIVAAIDRKVDDIETHVHKVCEEERKRLFKEHEGEVLVANNKFKLCTETLQSQKVRFETAIDVANQALRSGSDSDIASVYNLLTNSLEDMDKEEVEGVPHNIGQLSEFKGTSRRFTEVATIGNLLPYKVLDGKWEQSSTLIEDGNLSYARGISTTSSGKLVIANWCSSKLVKVYDSCGRYRLSFDNQSCHAWDVAYSRSNRKTYVTCKDVKHIRVFRSDGQCVSEFAAISPSGMSSDSDDDGTDLRGLAINDKNQLLVGEINNKYISVHDLNGSHITSFPVPIRPCFIATTSRGEIVVSCDSFGGVQMLDPSGSFLFTISKPEGVSSWQPTGVCCGVNDEMYISNCGSEGIYCFSSTGLYLRCIGEDRDRYRVYINNTVWGIALLQEDSKLVVVDYGCRRAIAFCRS